MKLDNFQNAKSLGQLSMLGYLIGGIATPRFSERRTLQISFAACLLSLGLSTMFMYFEVQGAGSNERMKYLVIIRSTGMMFPLFADSKLTPPNHVPC